MFKVSNSNPSNAQGQTPADLPIHTMKKDLEEIEHPSEFKKNEQESQERYILNDTQKSSPFLSSTPQPKQAPVSTSIRFKDETAEQRINEDRFARQQAEEKRLAEQRVAKEQRLEEQKIAEEKIAQQKAAKELISKQKIEEKRLAEQKIAEERLAKQKAVMAQKMAEENAAMERKMAEQKAEIEKIAIKQAEEQRKAAQRAAEEKRILEQKAEEKRLAEQKTSEQRLLKEKMIAEQKAEKEKEMAEKNAKKLANAENRTASKNVAYLIVSVILVLLIAGGGYYFWITRQQKEPVVIMPNPAPEPIPDPIPEPEPTPEPEPNDNINYLVIEQVSATAGEIKTTLKTYAEEFIASSETVPAEYIIVDAQNNPFTFSAFANALGIKLSPAVMSNLSDAFSLFIYNDQGATRLGLAIDSKDDNLLKTAMLAEEKTIIAEISPLFMDAVFTNPANLSFNKYTHNETELHYINLISSKPLSVDYGILNKKLLISTSKETTFAIVDYIKSSDTSTETE